MQGEDLVLVNAEEDKGGEDTDKESFQEFLEKDGIQFVKFYAPW